MCDTMLDWFLALNPFLAILIITIIYSLFIVAIYSLFVDLEEMRKLKKSMKDIQKDLRAATRSNDPKKLTKLRNKSIEISLKYNQKSMKPMLYTTIPALFLIGYLVAHYAYAPLMPNHVFNISIFYNKAYDGNMSNIGIVLPKSIELVNKTVHDHTLILSFLPKKEGNYDLKFKINNRTYDVGVIITHLYKVDKSKHETNDEIVKEIKVNYSPLYIFGNLSIFGWKPGWFSTYFFLSIFFNYLFRKMFNIP